MNVRILFVATSLLLACFLLADAKAQVLQNDASIAPPFFDGDFSRFEVGSASGSFFEISFLDEGNGQFTFSPSSIFERIAFFSVDVGEAIDENFPSNNRTFLSNSGGFLGGSEVNSLTVDFELGESQYFGYWDDQLAGPFQTGSGEIDAADNYGWARLTYDGTQLTVAESATAIGSGIIAGTLTTIPEPSSAALIAGVLCAMGLKRRR